MKDTVLIEKSHEGYAVSVPGLPGCHSQGETEAEALTNITDAIREYLEVVQESNLRARGASQGRAATSQPARPWLAPRARKI